MYLYSNLKHITETKISQNELAKLSNIPHQTINNNLINNREFKGTQIHKIFQALKSKGLVRTLDQLFYQDFTDPNFKYLIDEELEIELWDPFNLLTDESKNKIKNKVLKKYNYL